MWKAACWIGVSIVVGLGIYKVMDAMAEAALQMGKSVDEFLKDPEMMDRFFDNLEKIGVNKEEIDKLRKEADEYSEATTVN